MLFGVFLVFRKVYAMPKLKTRKALVKRLRVSKKGKILRRYSGKSHLNSGMSPKRRRQLRRTGQVAAGFRKRIKRALASAFSR
jgi:large subunit ribosomal protein L35